MSHPDDPTPSPQAPPPLPPPLPQGFHPGQPQPPQYPQQQPQAVLAYATPFRTPQEGYPAWRDENKLVTPTLATLPPQCVKCAAPADGQYAPRVFWWYHPALLLLLLLGVLGIVLFVIIALIVRKRATVHLGLCAAHLSRRRKVIAATTVMTLAGVAAIVGGFYAMEEYRNDSAAFLGSLAAVALWVIAAVLYTKFGAVLIPTRIDNQYAYFKRAGPDFLSLFPPVR